MARQTQSGQGADAGGRQTKAEKKEQARLERIELQRKMAARKRNRTILVIGVVAAALVIGGVVFLTGGSNKDEITVPLPNPDSLPGMLRTAPPWPNNTAQLPARLHALDLPQLNEQILHHHVRLFIFVDGKPVTVPMNIGLSQTAASPLHTHDTTGTVHVESADRDVRTRAGAVLRRVGRLPHEGLPGRPLRRRHEPAPHLRQREGMGRQRRRRCR